MNWQTVTNVDQSLAKIPFSNIDTIDTSDHNHDLSLCSQRETQMEWKTLHQEDQILVYMQVQGPDETA
jgi:hypothetical protein